MKWGFLTYCLLSVLFFNCQVEHSLDSVKHQKLRLFDCNLFTAFDFIQNEKRINLQYIEKFTEDPKHALENAGYPDTVRHTVKERRGGETDGGEFGLNASFRIHSKEKIWRRFRPRASVFYNYKQFFNYDVYLTKVQPAVRNGTASPEIDSTAMRHLTYSYYSEQMMFQLGTTYDIKIKPRFIIYSGLLFSQGYSFRNEFTTETRDDYRLDKKINGSTVTGDTTLVSLTSYSSIEPFSYSLGGSVPFGIQHRFSTGPSFSMGLMIEGRAGAGRYYFRKGNSVTYLLFAISAGLRFSFLPH